MKKIIIIIAYLLFICLMFIPSCNYSVEGEGFKYSYAIIKLPNGEIVEGKVDSWSTASNCDLIRIKINGTAYCTNIDNCVLIDKMEEPNGQ